MGDGSIGGFLCRSRSPARGAEAAGGRLADKDTWANVESTATFYRAIGLLQQGHEAEARTLLTVTQAKMKRLPDDDEKTPGQDRYGWLPTEFNGAMSGLAH